jgi:hypothetical protein
VGGAYREIHAIRVEDCGCEVFLGGGERDTIVSFDFEAFDVDKADESKLISNYRILASIGS